MYGGAGADYIDAGAGRDKIYGDDGDDTIIGGLGNDLITGGSGADVFVLEAGHGHDIIYDFEDGIDLINITALGLQLADLLATGSVNETIAAGGSFTFINGDNSITINNASSVEMTLNSSDFIFDNPLILA